MSGYPSKVCPFSRFKTALGIPHSEGDLGTLDFALNIMTVEVLLSEETSDVKEAMRSKRDRRLVLFFF